MRFLRKHLFPLLTLLFFLVSAAVFFGSDARGGPALLTAKQAPREALTRSGYAGEDGEPVNLNTADEAALEKLPLIGAARARSIVEDRQINGPFASVEDLTRVQGIGPGILSQIRDLIYVEETNENPDH